MPADLSRHPHWQWLVDNRPAYRKAWLAGVFPPIDPARLLSPGEAAAREAKRLVWLAKIKAGLRERFKLTYAASPLFNHCLDECKIFNPANLACLEPGMGCPDRHNVWHRRVTEGKCPHWEPA